MGGGGGPGAGPREGDWRDQGQGQPQVLQTDRGRAAAGRPEEGKWETRMETQGDDWIDWYILIFVEVTYFNLFSMILSAS